MALNPRLWASIVPRNPSIRKPNHYWEMARAAWDNRDQLGFAWRILNHGVCDGCALGTAGLTDWTLDDTHLCMVRLELMRLNTAPALDPERLADVSRLGALSSRALRGLGRLPEPMIRAKGEKGFRVVSWEEAYAAAAAAIRRTTPDRFAVYLTSRGILNEHYYAVQKATRAMGTNNVDNSARLCHAASTVAMKQTLGHGATTGPPRPSRALLRLDPARQAVQLDGPTRRGPLDGGRAGRRVHLEGGRGPPRGSRRRCAAAHLTGRPVPGPREDRPYQAEEPGRPLARGERPAVARGEGRSLPRARLQRSGQRGEGLNEAWERARFEPQRNRVGSSPYLRTA